MGLTRRPRRAVSAFAYAVTAETAMPVNSLLPGLGRLRSSQYGRIVFFAHRLIEEFPFLHLSRSLIAVVLSPNFTFVISLYIKHADRRVNVALHFDIFDDVFYDVFLIVY